MSALLNRERKRFHDALLGGVLTLDASGVASNADKGNTSSEQLSAGIVRRLGGAATGAKLNAQAAGVQFEAAVEDFLRSTFLKLGHLRPGRFSVERITARDRAAISEFEQFAHLQALNALAKSNPELAAALGNDYAITPDLVVARLPESDEVLNQGGVIVEDNTASLAALRERFQPKALLHASVSCKWTLRSDRAQNARSEALNLIRNRKGRLPHIVVVTAEPTPTRVSSLALGTGDIDCVYHFALPELMDAVREQRREDIEELLQIMVDGKRLKDIADLPLDLAV